VCWGGGGVALGGLVAYDQGWALHTHACTSREDFGSSCELMWACVSLNRSSSTQLFCMEADIRKLAGLQTVLSIGTTGHEQCLWFCAGVLM
jgi:hypothetical protein